MASVVITADIVCVIFLFIIVWGMLSSKEKPGLTERLFVISVVACIGATAIDAVSYIIDQNTVLTGLAKTVDTLAFVAGDFAMVPFIYYAWSFINEKRKYSVWFAHAAAISCAADLIFVLVGAFTENLFSVENGAFVRGPWYDYIGIIQIAVLCYLFVFIAFGYRFIGLSAVLSIGTYFFLPTAASIIDRTTDLGNYVYPAMSLVMMIVYVMLQSGELEKGRMRERIMFEVSNTDEMTKLNNGRAFEREVKKIQPDTPLGVIFCDMNGLKRINDRYGRETGDKAITDFAGCLKTYFSKEEIFRKGGGEFVILMQNIDEDLFLSQADRLIRSNERNGQPSAIGYVFGSGKEADQLIRRAEKDMYADKNEYYRKFHEESMK